MELLLFPLILQIVTIGLIYLACYHLLRIYMSRPKQPHGNSVEPEEKKIILPLRLQAYERLILYLERITPNNLVMRLNQTDMNAMQFQSLLIRTIREEFEYNLSQQLYISARAWELVRNAKEETVNLINQAGSKIEKDAPSADLVRIIFEQFLEKERASIDTAIDELKREIQKIF